MVAHATPAIPGTAQQDRRTVVRARTTPPAAHGRRWRLRLRCRRTVHPWTQKRPDPQVPSVSRSRCGEFACGVAGPSNPSAKIRSVIDAAQLTATSVTLAAPIVSLWRAMVQVSAQRWRMHARKRERRRTIEAPCVLIRVTGDCVMMRMSQGDGIPPRTAARLMMPDEVPGNGSAQAAWSRPTLCSAPPSGLTTEPGAP